MIAAWAELVLLLACLQVVAWSRQLPHFGFEFVLCGMIGFLPAVVIGGIEYLGFPGLHPWHRVASDVGAAFGLPVVLVGLAAAAQRADLPRRVLWGLLLLLPLGPLLGAARLPGTLVLLVAFLALGVAARQGGMRALAIWTVGVLMFGASVLSLRLRASHGDLFEALFHLWLAGFLILAAWLARMLTSADSDAFKPTDP